jgi:TatD DNase family protein
VEVLYSDYIKAIARAVPDHLLLTETDNPGGLKWLTGEVGMPSVISKVVDALAELRTSTPERIERTVQSNMIRLVDKDTRLATMRYLLSPSATRE